ncbi:serine hydrolase [Cupriavidus sp. UME77]|uniref:serine hydrolase domain-containing protein n=1 Tax=Cupriavidus sp. UME77 TaxID=1862321 RepID=UPI001600E70C|nr:serine hydrolase domain-containing protein [Cupriavidus sp. UME77]MBB1634601.1 hypothetical protein [Cupriavidus sp. UME77]
MRFQIPTTCHLAACAAAAVITLPSTAAEYSPVVCAARQAYAGRPLHAPLAGFDASLTVPGQPLDAGTSQRLDDAFALTRKAAAADAMTAAVAIAGAGLWHKTVAPADAPLLYWASAGKTLIAVVAMQLVEEKRLNLDDPVSRWVKDVPNGQAVTVRDLLAHTSGIFSANEDLRARANPRYRTPDEALQIARTHGAMFCPGSYWRYSNTGFDLLGVIIEAVDGQSFDQAIAARIISPLGLKSMHALRPGAAAPGIAPLASTKETPIEPGWPGAAGPIAADAADMARFWAALLGGQLLAPASVNAMFATLYPMFDTGTFYGLGVMVFDIANGDRQDLWLGHAGGTPGASALVFYSPADKAVVAVALTGDGPAAAVANYLLKQMRPARR